MTSATLGVGTLRTDWRDASARSRDLVMEHYWLKARSSVRFQRPGVTVHNPANRPCAVFLTAAGLLLADPILPIRFDEPAGPASYEQLALL